MHMADALISPAVGGTMWGAAAVAIACCSRCLRRHLDDRKIPLMGVLGAFIFAAQMINFTIPGTGSSGHIGGGMLLAILLGPAAGFVAMASVLTVQAFFFADGGLLALGSNIINLGAATCFVAYPLLFRPLAGSTPGRIRLLSACLIASVVGLQIGSFGVVAETVLSGRADLPFDAFLLLMQPIHLAIGLVEGGVTAVVVGLVWKAQPELLGLSGSVPAAGRSPGKPVLVFLLVAALLCAGLLSGFASTRPDGLEWALQETAEGSRLLNIEPADSATVLTRIQQRSALFPDYRYPGSLADEGEGVLDVAGEEAAVSGLAGGALTLLLLALAGWLLSFRQRRSDCL